MCILRKRDKWRRWRGWSVWPIKHITTIWEIEHKCNSLFFQMATGTSGTSVCPLLPFSPHLILVQAHPISYQLFCRICLSLCLGKITSYRHLKLLANSYKLSLKCAAIFLSYGCILHVPHCYTASNGDCRYCPVGLYLQTVRKYTGIWWGGGGTVS